MPEESDSALYITWCEPAFLKPESMVLILRPGISKIDNSTYDGLFI